VNVKLSHLEVIQACREWLLKHHGIIAPSDAAPFTIQTHGGNPSAMQINLEFVGIEPREITPPEDKPLTPYERGM
jgi:hypothetical protein